MLVLLLGMGNPILSDDAIGVRLARDFKKRLDGSGAFPHVSVVEECSVGGLNLLDLASEYQRLIVLDSTKTQGGTPGEWYSFTARALRETMHLSNVHDANFATALELGRRLGHKIPSENEIHILAVEVQDNFTFSETMTPRLEAVFPAIADEIFEELVGLLRNGKVWPG